MRIATVNVGEHVGSGEATNFNNGEPHTALAPAATFGRLGVDVNPKDALHINRQGSKGVSPAQGQKMGTGETRTYSHAYTSIHHYGSKESKNSVPPKGLASPFSSTHAPKYEQETPYFAPNKLTQLIHKDIYLTREFIQAQAGQPAKLILHLKNKSLKDVELSADFSASAHIELFTQDE